MAIKPPSESFFISLFEQFRKDSPLVSSAEIAAILARSAYMTGYESAKDKIMNEL